MMHDRDQRMAFSQLRRDFRVAETGRRLAYHIVLTGCETGLIQPCPQPGSRAVTYPGIEGRDPMHHVILIRWA